MNSTTAAAFLLLAAHAHADVLVVDASGGGEFTTLAAAVAVAVSGDVLLVRPGSYVNPIELDDLAVAILADVPGTVTMTESLDVKHLGPNDAVVLSGIRFEHGFSFADCSGHIQVEDCSAPRVTSGVPFDPPLGFPTMGNCGEGASWQNIVNCSHVALSRCELYGEDGSFGWLDGEPGQHGLIVEASDVTLYGCTLMGGDGTAAQWGTGHGAVEGGAGGDGLHLDGMLANVVYEELIAVGGTGALSPTPADISGCQGVPIRGLTANALTRAHTAFEAPALVRGAAPVPFRVEGPVGSTVLLVSSQVPGWRPLGTTTGNLMVGGPLRLSAHGPIPASGALDVSVSMFDLPTVEDSVPFFFQAVLLTSSGRLVTEPQHVTVVHPSL